MERDYWLPRGTDEAGASAHLVELAESLGCREPRVPSRPQAASLARGREAILTAVERAGGHAWARQLAASDPDAAFCLCLSLQQAVVDSRRRWLPQPQSAIRRRVEAAFAPLGPSCMRIVAAQLRGRVLGAAQRALAVVRLQAAFLRMHCQCCSQGPNARKREQLARQVRGLGQECQKALMCCKQFTVDMTDSNVLISSLYICTFTPCHQPAPFAMFDTFVFGCWFCCYSCCPDARDELAFGLGCRKLRQMASSCCGQWWAPCPTGRRLRNAQPSSSSTSCQATSGSLPT